ncbi:hypothetical protein T492DRAFT_1021920 [Pavlovales sp. CCMP2436]|nr:hypothetical protein T492DRAFT_1021920 [Pavlovales sp. CCMP2436]
MIHFRVASALLPAPRVRARLARGCPGACAHVRRSCTCHHPLVPCARVFAVTRCTSGNPVT